MTNWTDLRWQLWERCRGRCQACGKHLGAEGVVHHRQLRSQGGTDDPDNLVVLHDTCHTWLHNHPAEAKRRGLIVSSWNDPTTTPIIEGPCQ